MNKLHTAFIVAILCVLIVCVVLYFSVTKDYLCIEDPDLYFQMTKEKLVSLKGTPVTEQLQRGDTPMDELEYTENWDGCAVKCTYVFFRNRLLEAEYMVENISYNAAYNMAEKIVARQQAVYQDKKSYYCNPSANDGSTMFHMAHGTNTGAGGILFDFTYTNGKLRIYAVEQE